MATIAVDKPNSEAIQETTVILQKKLQSKRDKTDSLIMNEIAFLSINQIMSKPGINLVYIEKRLHQTSNIDRQYDHFLSMQSLRNAQAKSMG